MSLSHNDEMINALHVLRDAAEGAYQTHPEVRSAIKVLNNAGIFQVVDKMTARRQAVSPSGYTANEQRVTYEDLMSEEVD